MDKESILREWFYRLPKGYANVPYTKAEMDILHEVLAENGLNGSVFVNELDEPSDKFRDTLDYDDEDNYYGDELSIKEPETEEPVAPRKEGNSEPYNNAIKDRLGVEIIPEATGKYNIQKGKSFELKGWTAEDKKIFVELWPENANSAIIGKGEIALYWLFNYQKNPAKAEDTRTEGSGAPDLRIEGESVEVKSYKSHNMVTGLGRWSEFKEERRIVQNIFGIHALAKAFKDGDVANPITEITFKKAELETASESLFAFLNLKGLEQLEEIFGKDSIFANMIANAESVFPEMKTSLDASNVSVTELNKSSEPEQVAVQVLQMLAAKKYGLKPGNGGYIANVIPGTADVHFHYIDIEAITPKVTDSLNVSGGSIKGNLAKIFG
tara:strand:+ start:272 stop:1417 length:1146 start_codon:yes stop_codon:yes gene_type:complete